MPTGPPHAWVKRTFESSVNFRKWGSGQAPEADRAEPRINLKKFVEPNLFELARIDAHLLNERGVTRRSHRQSNP